jgi:uncharacterized membrane protein
MHEAIAAATEFIVLVIEGLVVVFITIGTVEAFVRACIAVFTARDLESRMRHIYLRFARWPIGSLTLLLAADIAESTVSPTWESIGQLGVIAVIRTFLNYFLERDIREVREVEAEKEAPDPISRPLGSAARKGRS